MTTLTAPTETTTNFDDAIAAYSTDAERWFQDARDALPAREVDAETAETDVVSAFTQLSAAARMQFEQRSRVGFDAVVDLMEATADAGAKISAKLVTLLHAEPGDAGQPQAADYKLIDELRTALDVLSRLSPSAVWTAPGDGANGR
jgi:hypothetical protein